MRLIKRISVARYCAGRVGADDNVWDEV